MTLPEEDIRLLDRMAALDGKNRSEMMRYLLAEMRPLMTQLIDTLDAANASRDKFMGTIATATLSEFEVLRVEAEKLDQQVVGALSRLEGAMTAKDAARAADPQAGNNGGHKSDPRAQGN
jgi:phage I-like protein